MLWWLALAAQGLLVLELHITCWDVSHVTFILCNRLKTLRAAAARRLQLRCRFEPLINWTMLLASTAESFAIH